MKQIKIMMFVLVLAGIGVGYCLGIIHQISKQPPPSPQIYWVDFSDDSQNEKPNQDKTNEDSIKDQIKDTPKPKPSRFNSFTSTITITTTNLETQDYAIRQAKELSKLVKSIPSVKDITIDQISANTEDQQYPIYP